MIKFLLNIFKYLLILCLPILGLIRGSVYLHQVEQYSPWFSVFGGMAITTIVIIIYSSIIYSWATSKTGSFRSFIRRIIFSLILVSLYSIYTLFYLPTTNSKSVEIQKSFTDLHPILRLSISTIILIDDSLIITDGKRQPEDYRKMGLPTKRNSLHYKQSNGFVHAVDIRTKGQPELRNVLLKGYFKVMGLNTLRHTGTADHLHISLTNIHYPNRI